MHRCKRLLVLMATLDVWMLNRKTMGRRRSRVDRCDVRMPGRIRLMIRSHSRELRMGRRWKLRSGV